MFTCGEWAVSPVSLTEPTRPDKRACLPVAPAEHLAVTCHGFLVGLVACPRTGTYDEQGRELLDLSPLAEAFPNLITLED